MKVRMSVVAAAAAVVLGTTGALVVPAVASASSTVAATKFLACLGTNVQGIHKGANKVAMQGIDAAEAAEPTKIKVKILTATAAPDYATNISVFIGIKCGLIMSVGSVMAPATESAAKANPRVKFAIVNCSYASGCLASPKLKNLVPVKDSASAVKSLVLARANGT